MAEVKENLTWCHQSVTTFHGDVIYKLLQKNIAENRQEKVARLFYPTIYTHLIHNSIKKQNNIIIEGDERKTREI